MIKILCLHISPRRPSYRYRVKQFLPYWPEYGISLDPVCISGKETINLFRYMLRYKEYDYVWIQRKALPVVILKFISLCTRVIYDFDDAVYARECMTTETINPQNRGKIGRFHYTLKKSAMVLAGNATLKSYADRFNPVVHIIPTSLDIPAVQNGQAPESDVVTIGWIGVNSNLFFLWLIDQATRHIQEKYPNVRFSVMSGKKPEELKTEWELSEWSSENEKTWLSSIDIGVMPLTDDDWSRGKCAFKLLQYMAYGKPVVASDVGANRDVVSDGLNGFLVDDLSEWTQALEKLITQHGLRHSMGENGKAIFEKGYKRELVQRQIAGLIQDDHEKRNR
ncbi:MAG: glycosyltransferase family 4 protein [Chlorobiaceae bacterium]|nr:glycosyltransferase family 4 protein [Chlorobiaceae bacterium]